MTLRHVDPRYENRRAVAPYNFVPLPEKVLTIGLPKSQDLYEGHSGYFECELETSTHTYIRGMISEEAVVAGNETKDAAGFFSLDAGATPLIPGSSLRGLFRSLIEVVSYSKLSWVTDVPLAYRALDTTNHGRYYRKQIMDETAKNTFKPRVRAGYMREVNGDWFIQPAEEIDGTTFARIPIKMIPDGLSSWHEGCRNSSQIYIQAGSYNYQDVRGFIKIRYRKVTRAETTPGKGLQKGVLAVSGRMKSKAHEAVVFQPDPHKVAVTDWLPVDEKRVRAYRDQISDEQRKLLGNNGVLNDRQPVFYLFDSENQIFFGHTLMMRLPYMKSPRDLVPDKLRDGVDAELDLAEAMFGWTPESKSERTTSCAGRVFFSDGKYASDKDGVFDREVTLKVLSGPKPTTFQHYLEQDKSDDKLRLHNYDSKNARVRGHKFYWQKGEVSLKEIEETDTDKLKHKSQYTRVRPIKPGVRFTFKIHFDNLTPQELGALVWVLRTGSDDKYRLKLGMGKPLGMGAVRIVKSDLVWLKRDKRYSALFDGESWSLGNEKGVMKEFDEALSEFSDWVLADQTVNPANKTQTVDELNRIKALLKLLSWPGPARELTRYMEIEHHRNGNEYKERPVLPGVFGVEARMEGRIAPPSEPIEENTVFEKDELVVTKEVTPQLSPEENARIKKDANEMAAKLKQRAKEQEDEEEYKRQQRAAKKKGKKK